MLQHLHALVASEGSSPAAQSMSCCLQNFLQRCVRDLGGLREQSHHLRALKACQYNAAAAALVGCCGPPLTASYCALQEPSSSSVSGAETCRCWLPNCASAGSGSADTTRTDCWLKIFRMCWLCGRPPIQIRSDTSNLVCSTSRICVCSSCWREEASEPAHSAAGGPQVLGVATSGSGAQLLLCS